MLFDGVYKQIFIQVHNIVKLGITMNFIVSFHKIDEDYLYSLGNHFTQ